MASDRMFRNLAIPAVRYALGRMTYIVGDVCDAIEYHADLLSPEERATIVRDIDEHDDGLGGLGMASDAYRWRALRAALTPQPAPERLDIEGNGTYTAYVDGRACHLCGLEPYRHKCPTAEEARNG